jgi:hypothetical protein
MNWDGVILCLFNELMTISKIERACEAINLGVEWFEQEDLLPIIQAPRRNNPAEFVEGYGGWLLDQITQKHPALIICDLNAIDPAWIGVIKSASASRRYPLIAFGPHVQGNLIKKAKSDGADEVFIRSKFFAELPDILQKYVKKTDQVALTETCQAPLASLARQGIELFNKGEYFEAHEILEEAWNQDSSPGRELYRAILQVAVAYLQIERDNYNGAIKMFYRLRQWIDPLPETCRGVNVGQLRRDAQAVYDKLLEVGRDNLSTFDRRTFKKIQYQKIQVENK